MLWPLGDEQCLLVLQPDGWENLLAQLKQQELSEEEKAATERVLGGSVAWLELDSAGRLALPEQLLSRIGIREEALIVGRLGKFEVWNPDRFQQVIAENRKTAAVVGKRLKV